jgi:transposase
MYVRKTQKTVKGKTYVNYLLVKSVATAKGPRQRTICSLGDLSPRPASEWLKLAHKVEQSLAGQCDLLEAPDAEVEAIVAKVCAREAAHEPAADERTAPKGDEDLVAIHTDRVDKKDERAAGPVHVGWEFWKRLGVDEILRAAGLDAPTRLLTLAMVMNRLIAPAAEYAMPEWIRSTALGDLVGEDFSALGHQPLYRNMDRLHEKREAIESALVARERDLFNLDTTVYLYDLTSTYFEGDVPLNRKAKRGYSRDKRPDCKQVVVGLVVNRDGFPLAHEVFDGNVRDSMTVGRMLDILMARVAVRPGATVVVDRGMATKKNREEIRARGLHYIVALRQSERDRHLSEFETVEGFEPVHREVSPNNPHQTSASSVEPKKPRVEVKTARGGGEMTLVLCRSEGREAKDRAIREKQETRLLADVAKLQAAVANGRLRSVAKIHQRIGRLLERYPRVARYYAIAYDEAQRLVTCTCDTDRRYTAEMLDGSYIMETSRDDLPPDDAWRIYSLLTRAESAFRTMKSPLAERPIFHHLEHRADTHIFLCLLAYHLVVAIEKTLRDGGLWTSWATVRKTLAKHQIGTIILPAQNGWTLRIRRDGRPDPDVADLYHRLGVPRRLLAPVKTWTREALTDSD